MDDTKLMPLAEIAAVYGVDPATVRRWCSIGRKLPDGTRRKLEAVRMPGRYAATLEAVRQFLEQPEAMPTQLPPNQKKWQRDCERAIAELAAMGIQ